MTTRHPMSTKGLPSQLKKGPLLARDGREDAARNEAADKNKHNHSKKPAKFKRDHFVSKKMWGRKGRGQTLRVWATAATVLLLVAASRPALASSSAKTVYTRSSYGQLVSSTTLR